MIETNNSVHTLKVEPTVVVSATENRPPPMQFRNADPPAWMVKMLKWLFPVLAVLFVALIVIPSFLQKWLWMRQLDYSVIFWTMFSVRVGLTLGTFAFAFLFLWLNIRQAARNSLAVTAAGYGGTLRQHIVTRSTAPVVAVISAVFASGMYMQWDTWLRFRYGGSFGAADPVFGRDLGFYMFRLPWYELLQSSLAFIVILAIVGVLAQYAYFGILRLKGQRIEESGGAAVKHSSILLIVLTAIMGWGFYLDRFDLFNSTRGVVYGVGYTADRVTLPALWGMIGVSLIACLLLAFNFYRPRWRVLAIGGVSFVALYIVGLMLLPALVQKFVVQPNELKLETPYLTNYIAFTRKAYGLDAIRETAYPAMADLTPAILARNDDTIQNIRLWDKRPLLQTYQQTQAIRLYYKFDTVDVDRYHLADGYHQVMLSTREISPELPSGAQTWVNQNLQFTHGYGLVMNFVSKSVG